MARQNPILWNSNKHWTHRAIEFLLGNPNFRIKLFSDSTSKAKSVDRKKVQAKERLFYMGNSPNIFLRMMNRRLGHRSTRVTKYENMCNYQKCLTGYIST